MSVADAEFMRLLLNDADWLRYIGDRGVRTVEQAEQHILHGPVAMYVSHGFGFGVVELRETSQPIGICGLAKRDYLDSPDIGFALLPGYRRYGYAYEAAAATLHYATAELALPRVVATTRLDNIRSQTLLEKLGLRYERTVSHPDGDRELKLYATATRQP